MFSTHRFAPLTSAAVLLVALLPLGASPAHAQDAVGRRPLDHDDYDRWNRVGFYDLSEDGRWARFSIDPVEGAATLKIREIGTRKEYSVKSGSRAQFTHDSRHVAYLVEPDPELVKKLREDDDRKGPMPKPRLEILDLESGEVTTIADVDSFSFPEDGDGWIVYSPSDSGAKAATKAGEAEHSETYLIEGAGLVKPGLFEEPPTLLAPEKEPEPEEPKSEPEAEGEAKSAPAEGEAPKAAEEKSSSAPKGKKPKEKKAREKENGDVLVLRDLESGVERRFPDVTSHRWGKHGKVLVFATSATDAEDDGVFVLDLASGEVQQIASGRGEYSSLSVSEDETRVAFLTDRHDYGPVKPSLTLYLWTAGEDEAKKVADAKHAALPKDWWLASRGVSFTEDGGRLLFETQPRPEDAGKTKEQLEKEKKAKARDPEAVLDVWHWKDEALQPQQLLEANRERNRSYAAIYHIADDKVVQVETLDVPQVSIDRESMATVAVGRSDKRYAVSRSWESPSFADTYLVDLTTGEATLIIEGVRASGSLSPDGNYVTWWDPEKRSHFALSVADLSVLDLCQGLPVSFADELDDTPAPPSSYGSAGWIAGDAALLIYDRYDIWRVDATGAEPARCVTGDQAGRNATTRYRYVQLDREQRFVPEGEPVLVSILDEATKASGYGTLDMATGEIVPKLVLDEQVSGLRKAERGETVLLTRQTFRRYPDVWASTLDFAALERLSWANPQQREYLWGTAELVDYQAADGTPLQGILYKPDDFDPNRKYPMMVYFYERNSDRLHSYVTPSAGSSSINYAFYVSRGYVLFVPDIPYTEGQPGRSAADAVLPGVQTILDMGFVDPKRVGVQGHSWGGYQIAYLVTMTDMFACAEAGAPVSNMTSAYGGIRWASGMSRMFQYEKTQSRIGGTLWEARDLYLENSPVFFADKVNTPLLMLHNDDDGAVPWYQGIEMFVALRRLDKPVWMLNYNNEGHGLRRDENKRDFAKRMQQFFDHYLMDAPATKWIAQGVPAVDKGKDLGLGKPDPEPEAEPEPAPVLEPVASPVAAPVAEEPVGAGAGR